MSRLEWDQVGEKTFQTGVDRGVLYLPDIVVPWNGLTGVEETINAKTQPYYQDGIKYFNQQVLSDYSATLKAFTYPDVFERCIGVQPRGNGVFYHDQPGESFNLSYRTLLGNDASGLDHGYIIHVLYNLLAIPSAKSFSSVGSSIDPMEFSWALTSTPEMITWRRPTAHISIKSTATPADKLAMFESMLYGSESTSPYTPTIDVFDNA